MKKSLLFGLLIAGNFLFFKNDASAAESSPSIDSPIETTENIINFDSDKQDILVTDDIIIRTISPLNSDSHSAVEDNSITTLGAGQWDLLGGQDVYAKSKVWHSSGRSMGIGEQ